MCLAALAGAAGCVHAPAKGAAPPPPSASGDVYGPSPPPGGAPPSNGEVYGPSALPPGVAAPADPSVYGPERIQYKPILLVLGPGLARGFAHIGVMRALHAAKIPIAGIIGTEMGAFVASLYAFDPNMNHFEWSLQRFKDDEFGTGQGFLTKLLAGGSDGQRFEDDLDKVFGRSDVQACKIPLRIGLSVGSGPLYVSQGSIAQAVRAAMASPGLLSAGIWEGGPAYSATRAQPFGISEARALAPGSAVVVVDVASAGQLSRADDLKDADLVVRPELRGIGPADFGKRTDAAYQGKSAIEKQLHEIRHLVGLPEEPDPSVEASQ